MGKNWIFLAPSVPEWTATSASPNLGKNGKVTSVPARVVHFDHQCLIDVENPRHRYPFRDWRALRKLWDQRNLKWLVCFRC